MKFLDLKDKMPFGKWKDCSIEDLVNHNEFSYLIWFDNSIEDYKLNSKVFDAIDNRKYFLHNNGFYNNLSKQENIHMGSYGNEFASENGLMEYF